MRINNNLMSMNTYRQYSINTNNAAASTEKLSSGYRINRAGDDAAGLAISEKMRAQIRGLNMASKNSQDAISLVQTAEGALNETHSILQRMRELATQSSSDTNDTDVVDRDALDKEFQALKAEIDDIAGKTAFNGKKLLDGSFGAKVEVATGSDLKEGTLGITKISVSGFADADLTDGAATQHTITITGDGTNYTAEIAGSESVTVKQPAAEGGVLTFNFNNGKSISITLASHNADDLSGDLIFDVTGADALIQTGANENDTMALGIGDMSSSALGLTAADLKTQPNASKAITTVNNAINQVSTERSKLGAYQNRLQHKINNLDTSAENLSAAESRIRDLDMAKEMTNYTKNNILVQAATAMLAQANSAPQGVLQLLQ